MSFVQALCGTNNSISALSSLDKALVTHAKAHRSDSLVTGVSQYRTVENGHGGVHQMRVEEEEDPPQSMMLYQSPPTLPETIHNDTY